MCTKYSLTAIPWPLNDSNKYKGHLEYVLFVASDGNKTHKWSSTYTRKFVDDLSRIVPAGKARDITDRLNAESPSCFRGLSILSKFGGISVQQKAIDMSTSMARFLIELLHGEEDAIEALEVQAAKDPELTPDQRTSLLDLQTRYENLCDFLRKVIEEHE